MNFFKGLFVPILLIPFLFSCLDDAEDDPSEDKENNEFRLVSEVGDKVLSGKLQIVSGEELLALLQKAPDDYYLLDERDLNTFASGYIEGATRTPYIKLIDEVSKTVDLPKDKTIVCVCYSGQKAAQVASFLSMIGYDAITLKYGMCGWTTDSLVLKTDKWSNETPLETALETEVHDITTGQTHDFPEISTEKTKVEEIISYQTYDYFYTLMKMVKASTLAKDAKDYFILDLRDEKHYKKGHLPGSYRVDIDEFGYAEKLKYLPTDKKIAVVSYTSHKAHYLSYYLNILGYDSYALKYGINAFSKDEALCGKNYYEPPEKDLPVVAQRTLRQMFDAAESDDDYEKHIVLEKGKTYVGGLTNGRNYNTETHKYDLGDEAKDLRIECNGAILDLQGEEIKTSVTTKRMDINNCIILNGGVRYFGDIDADNANKMTSPVGFVKNCTFYKPEKYAVRIQGAGESITVSGNIFYEAQDVGFDLDPYTKELNNGLPTGINCAFSTKISFGQPDIKDNWSFHTGEAGKTFRDFAKL